MVRLLAVSLIVACGGPGASIDASITVDIDNGSCGDQLRFTGEYIDWDADAHFCGVNQALVKLPGGEMGNTAPNGRFDLCIPSAPARQALTITPSTAMSECTIPRSTYSLPTIAIATKAVILAGNFWSGRNFTIDRQATLGITLDPGKAHVFVHVGGTPRAVSLAAAHATPQAIATTLWADGDTGHEVFFPNVELGTGTTTVSCAGGAIGTGEVPLAAGTITTVDLIAN